MLVLSRRPDEKILLPTVPALIKVISANAGLVRLGFEAPGDVPILREELTRDDRQFPLVPLYDEDGAEPARHLLRNRLSNLTLATTLLRIQLTECDPLVRKTLDRIEEDLRALRKAVRASSRETVVA
jgi:carbon storage regulator CsrA